MYRQKFKTNIEKQNTIIQNYIKYNTTILYKIYLDIW
jgi:hypothetical protein